MVHVIFVLSNNTVKIIKEKIMKKINWRQPIHTVLNKQLSKYFTVKGRREMRPQQEEVASRKKVLVFFDKRSKSIYMLICDYKYKYY